MSAAVLTFNCYLYSDAANQQRGELDLERIAECRPAAIHCSRSNRELRLHLNHLAFLISVIRPDLEGKVLDAELHFQGPEQLSKLTLVVNYDGRALLHWPVHIDTLDLDELAREVAEENPRLNGQRLVFTFRGDDHG